MSKCKACRFFDCGDACECTCHSTFNDDRSHISESGGKPIKCDAEVDEAMEGLSSLFG